MTVLIAVAFALLVPQAAPSPACGTWQQCRDVALEAAARRDYETFHDLAWRAMQAGPRNDPALMQLLARAQSLSGRPGDALVMLQRLAAMGVVTDAATSEDFAAVRRLPRWPELQAQIETVRAGGPVPTTPLVASAPVVSTPAVASPPDAPIVSVPPPAKPEAASPPVSPAPPGISEALRFTAPQFMPGGLAYDAVSRRFIVGHRDARKLSVVDEFSRQIANLAASGFADITALEIDPREGTLWVVSAGEPAAGSTAPSTALHKLQLISGRALETFSPPTGSGARFVDVVVAPNGVVLVLDSEGRRIYRLVNGGRALEEVMALGDIRPKSLAATAGAIAYVAHETGVLRADLTTRGISRLSPANPELAGIEWIRWHRGALIGLQKSPTGHGIVRLRSIKPGERTQIEILDAQVQSPGRATATIAGDVLYILAAASGTELAIQKLPLRER